MRSEIMASYRKARSQRNDPYKVVFDFQEKARYRKTYAEQEGRATQEDPVEKIQPLRFIRPIAAYHNTPATSHFPYFYGGRI